MDLHASSVHSITAVVNVKIIEMANQIKVSGVYCSQKQSTNSSTTHQFNVERERGKMKLQIILY